MNHTVPSSRIEQKLLDKFECFVFKILCLDFLSGGCLQSNEPLLPYAGVGADTFPLQNSALLFWHTQL